MLMRMGMAVFNAVREEIEHHLQEKSPNDKPPNVGYIGMIELREKMQ
jgi:hypothetical protein